MGTYKNEPTSNEIEVREWFAAHLAEFDYSIVASQGGFPDLLLEDKDGIPIRAEVEFASASFIAHGHDPQGCDLIICWRHTQTLPLPVLELSIRRMYQPGESPGHPAPYPRKSKWDLPEKEGIIKAMVGHQVEVSAFLGAAETDLMITSEYSRRMVQPRLELFRAGGALTKILNEAGVEVGDLHPYDLLKLIA